MKNNLEWYRHKVESHNHLKFKTLRLLFKRAFNIDGWTGEGKFWALNNMIADANFCMLKCDTPLQRLAIATELEFTIDEFDQFIKILMHDCNLVRFEDGCILTDDTQDCLSDVQEKRINDRNRQQKRREMLERERLSHVTNSQSGRDNTMSHSDNYFSHVTDENITRDQHTEKRREEKSREEKRRNSAENKFSSGGSEEVFKDGINGSNPAEPEQQKNAAGKKTSTRGAKKSPEETTPHWSKLMDIFVSFRAMISKSPYVWSKKDFPHLKFIADSLQKISEGEGREWTLQECSTKFNQFLFNASKIEFLKKGFTLSKLANQINEVLSYQPDQSINTPYRNGVYTEAMAKYKAFYVSKKSLEPLVKPKDETALDQLIVYFRKVTADKIEVGATPDEMVIKALDMVYSRWDMLEPFYKDRMDLSDIYNNINKIIEQIKNNSNGQRTNAGSNRGFTSNFANREEMVDYIDEALKRNRTTAP